MHWSDVQLVFAVVQHGSMRAAARALALDVSTVSRRLSGLEHLTGVRLFDRSTSGLALTPAGRLVAESAGRVDAELATLGRALRGHDKRLGGRVMVTFPGSLAPVVHGAVSSLLERFPDVELELLTLDALVDLGGQRADVAVRVAAQAPDDLVGRRVAALAASVYAARGYLRAHPRQLDADSHRWVDWDRRLATKPAFAWLDERYPSRRVIARGLSTTDVLGAVRAGVGVGALPCIVGDAEPGLVRLVDAPREVWSPVWVLAHRDVRTAARVRAVTAHLVGAVAAARNAIEGVGRTTAPTARRPRDAASG